MDVETTFQDLVLELLDEIGLGPASHKPWGQSLFFPCYAILDSSIWIYVKKKVPLRINCSNHELVLTVADFGYNNEAPTNGSSQLVVKKFDLHHPESIKDLREYLNHYLYHKWS